MPRLGVRHDHPADGAVIFVAAAAEQAAFQVMMMRTVPLPRALGRNDVLDARVHVAVDEGIVAPFVNLILEPGEAEIVRILQEPQQLVIRDLASRAFACCPGPKPPERQLIGKGWDAVVARRIQLECDLHERRTFSIELHGPHLAVFDTDADVLVAERCAEHGAALTSLLPQLVADVRSIFGGAELVERRQDALHQLSDGRRVNMLGCRDKRHLMLLQHHHRVCFVVAVSMQARQLIDQHDINVALFTDATQHLLERNALRRLGTRAPRLDILVNDLEPELLRLVLAGESLGG